ncbi:CD177 antigen-like [Mus caroli]|uniref:CD177 antigen-like n=1 Tax=Mus caroli TaxID=10089 RepID=A0A6P5P8N0_MUSCR|nr:CD177 antigen-like [Mus caroli]
MKFGQNFSKTSIEWIVDRTIALESNKGKMCQETFLLIDVGTTALILGSKGPSIQSHRNVRNITVFARGPGLKAIIFYHVCDIELCNRANSTRMLIDSIPSVAPTVRGRQPCPICLHFKGVCNSKSNLAICPRGTRCYMSDLTLHGGGLSAIFSISGCLVYPQKFLMKNQSSIGTITLLETRLMPKRKSSSQVLVPSILLTWMFGLLALCLQRSILC